MIPTLDGDQRHGIKETYIWLRNCWYVIAWDHEIPAADDGKLFTRKVLNEPILVYRTTAGEFVALEDRCCHRHAPLSVGRREGDAVREFDRRNFIGPDIAVVRRVPLLPGRQVEPELESA